MLRYAMLLFGVNSTVIFDYGEEENNTLNAEGRVEGFLTTSLFRQYMRFLIKTY